jgi:hypothetical protein
MKSELALQSLGVRALLASWHWLEQPSSATSNLPHDNSMGSPAGQYHFYISIRRNNEQVGRVQ